MTVLLMRRPLQPAEPAASWPAGYRLMPFSAEHANAAHALLVEAYRAGGGSVTAALDEWWHAVSTDEEFDPALCFLVVAADDTPAAFALCWTSSFIKDLAVAPDHQRRGVATALLSTIFAALAERGCREVRLKVQSDNPSRAQDLYARLGFTPA